MSEKCPNSPTQAIHIKPAYISTTARADFLKEHASSTSGMTLARKELSSMRAVLKQYNLYLKKKQRLCWEIFIFDALSRAMTIILTHTRMIIIRSMVKQEVRVLLVIYPA